MAVIGDQFDVGSEICGIVLSIRGAEDILSIWNQSSQGGRTNLKIRYACFPLAQFSNDFDDYVFLHILTCLLRTMFIIGIP
jgi:hypothetical protein